MARAESNEGGGAESGRAPASTGAIAAAAGLAGAVAASPDFCAQAASTKIRTKTKDMEMDMEMDVDEVLSHKIRSLLSPP
jgi:hypothetical protein